MTSNDTSHETASSSRIEEEELPDDFEVCIFCSRELDSNKSFILRCLHFSCTACLQTLITDKEQKECPVCKVKSLRSEVIQNKLSVSLNPEIKCSNHPDVEGNIWCNKCEWICSTCEKCHRELRLHEHQTQPHRLVFKGDNNYPSKSNFTVVEDESMCKEHPEEIYKLYCQECKCFTCRNCQLEKHRGHKYIFLKEIVGGFKRTYKEMMSQMDYKKIILKKSSELFKTRNNAIKEAKYESQKRLNGIIQSLQAFVKNLELNLKQEIERECEERIAKNIKMVEEAEEFIKVIEHTDEFVKRTLQLGENDFMIMYLQKQISRHLSFLVNKQHLLANPDFKYNMTINAPTNWKQHLNDLKSSISIYIEDKAPVTPSQPAQ